MAREASLSVRAAIESGVPRDCVADFVEAYELGLIDVDPVRGTVTFVDREACVRFFQAKDQEARS